MVRLWDRQFGIFGGVEEQELSDSVIEFKQVLQFFRELIIRHSEHLDSVHSGSWRERVRSVVKKIVHVFVVL